MFVLIILISSSVVSASLIGINGFDVLDILKQKKSATPFFDCGEEESCISSDTCPQYQDSSLGDNGYCECVAGCCDCSQGAVVVEEPIDTPEEIAQCKLDCGENMVEVCTGQNSQTLTNFLFCYRSCVTFIPFVGCKGFNYGSCGSSCFESYQERCSSDAYDECIASCD